MISQTTLTKISHIFCGDEGDCFSYKSGPQLVSFFNNYFKANDKYQQGFPSRGIYVYNKLVGLLNSNQFDLFLDTILSKVYIMNDKNCTPVEAVTHAKHIYEILKDIVYKDLYLITHINGKYHLCQENSDLELIGEGGFANVYRQKSTGLAIKQLKEDYLTDKGIRSRFKREFNITKSLHGDYGIIEVYTYDEANCSYSMELAENTLEDYLSNPNVTEKIRIDCIERILYIMQNVHKKDIIHRDLSPNNIFVINGNIKIADFGLGKDLNVLTSHQTIHTNAVGQYCYCAPEQFMLLKDGDKRSDVYSLGRIINYIMTGNPTVENHRFRRISEKATNHNAAYRFADAEQLLAFFHKSLEYQKQERNEDLLMGKIENSIFDNAVEDYLYELNSQKLIDLIVNHPLSVNTIVRFMQCDDAHAQFVIQNIDTNYQEVGWGKPFSTYDPFATLAYEIIKDDSFSYVVKEIACNILRYVAKDVNRFHAQRKVEELLHMGIDPTLEEILTS